MKIPNFSEWKILDFSEIKGKFHDYAPWWFLYGYKEYGGIWIDEGFVNVLDIKEIPKDDRNNPLALSAMLSDGKKKLIVLTGQTKLETAHPVLFLPVKVNFKEWMGIIDWFFRKGLGIKKKRMAEELNERIRAVINRTLDEA